MAFSPDGRRIVTAQRDKTARCGTPTPASRSPSSRATRTRLRSVAFSPDGRRLATASEDKTARLWDADTGKPLAVLQGHTDSVSCPWPSAPTAGASPPAAVTTRRGCGTPTPASSSPFSRGTRARFGPWRSAPTADASPPPATTRRRSCGTPTPASRSPFSRATPTGCQFRGVQPRRPTHRHRQPGPDGAGVGRRQRTALAVLRDTRTSVVQRGVQPRRPAHRHRQRGPDGAAVGRRHRHSRSLSSRGIRGPLNSVASAPTADASSPPARTRRRGCGTPTRASRSPSSRGTPSGVSSVAFSPDGRRLVTASWTRRRGCGTPTSGKQLAVLQGHTSRGHRGLQPRRPTHRHRQPGPDGAAVGRRLRQAARRSRGTAARFGPWRSAPTAGASPRQLGQDGAAVGRRIRQARSPSSKGTRTGLAPWRSAPTADASSRPATIRRRGCGTPTSGKPLAVLQGTPAGFTPWRSAPTADASPRRATTRRRGCGTPTPASRSPSSRGTLPVRFVAFSPDGRRIVTAERRQDGAAVGRRLRQAPRRPPGAHRPG